MDRSIAKPAHHKRQRRREPRLDNDNDNDDNNDDDDRIIDWAAIRGLGRDERHCSKGKSKSMAMLVFDKLREAADRGEQRS